MVGARLLASLLTEVGNENSGFVSQILFFKLREVALKQDDPSDASDLLVGFQIAKTGVGVYTHVGFVGVLKNFGGVLEPEGDEALTVLRLGEDEPGIGDFG